MCSVLIITQKTEESTRMKNYKKTTFVIPDIVILGALSKTRRLNGKIYFCSFYVSLKK